MDKKKIVFITGTRADYGKIKPLLMSLEKNESYDLHIFVCGMHLSEKLGSTYKEVEKDGYENIYIENELEGKGIQSINLGNTIKCFTEYTRKLNPDMIVVHGDRIEALAGATVGALNNIIVAHIEGGEVSGTIDESIRHAVSKFAHIHFVCNEEAKNRLIQLGEDEGRIYQIGSPDIDVMMSDNLPSLEDTKNHYEIDFDKYAILMYHPVTTEINSLEKNASEVVKAISQTDKNYIVVYPNNDLGSDLIIDAYKELENKNNIKIYPSLRFEYFLTLLKNSDFIVGNSSAGIREAGAYGIPAIDIGTRQNGRYGKEAVNVQHVNENADEIISAIGKVDDYRKQALLYGKGNSTELFMKALEDNDFWNVSIQKTFVDK